jgi:hypothetical protein
MKTIQLNQNSDLEFEIQLNYEKCVRIEQLRNLMKKFKNKDKELYKRFQREYFDLIR